MKVIDVSSHNGNIDFEKVKASGVWGVIIRAGYGKEYTQKDACFEDNYYAAVKAGLHVGAYWYSYAENAADAKREADCFRVAIEGKQFDLPVYLDIEETKSQRKADEIITAFCNRMEEHRYFVGVYASKAFFNSWISSDVRKRFTVWVAQWSNQNTCNFDYGMWQMSSTMIVPGISGHCDLSECYEDFPDIIRTGAFNGYETIQLDFETDTEELHTIEIFIDGTLVYNGTL